MCSPRNAHIQQQPEFLCNDLTQELMTQNSLLSTAVVRKKFWEQKTCQTCQFSTTPTRLSTEPTLFIALQVLHFPLLHANEWLLQKTSPACSNLLLSTKQLDDTDCGWAARSRRQKAQQLSAGTVPSKDAGRHKPLLSRLRQTLWRAEIVSAISCLFHYASEHRYCSSELTTGHTLQELSRLSHLYQNLPPPPTPQLLQPPFQLPFSPCSISPPINPFTYFFPYLGP